MPKGIVHCNCIERIAGISGLVTITAGMSDEEISRLLTAKWVKLQEEFNACASWDFDCRLKLQPFIQRSGYDKDLFKLKVQRKEMNSNTHEPGEMDAIYADITTKEEAGVKLANDWINLQREDNPDYLKDLNMEQLWADLVPEEEVVAAK